MQDYGTVLETMERPVYHAESGSLSNVLMAATIYRPQRPVLVLTREISTPNATGVTVFYTVIYGSTLEDWKRNLAEMDLMIWSPLRDLESGIDLSSIG